MAIINSMEMNQLSLKCKETDKNQLICFVLIDSLLLRINQKNYL